jgi:hypothetical protein
MFDRYGTRLGLSRCPGPWRLSSNTVMPSQRVSTMASLGVPKGVSISCRATTSAPSPSTWPSPEPPINPTRNSPSLMPRNVSTISVRLHRRRDIPKMTAAHGREKGN